MDDAERIAILEAKLEKVARWLDRLAVLSDEQANANAGAFESLAEACRADAKNWRSTAADIRKIL